jgi:hypothetical protein
MAQARTDMAMAYSYLDYKLNLNIFTTTITTAINYLIAVDATSTAVQFNSATSFKYCCYWLCY